jgi:DNA (cytosine-5)-methyltransferase 1
MKKLKQIGQLYGTEREPNPQAGRIYDASGISPTLDTCQGGCRMPKIESIGRVRKLTPRECFRLQGFPDDLFERAASVNVDSQLYKQAGNSVTVNVIYEIAKRLKEIENDNYR